MKLCHFIRHGEGIHNVAQRQWRARNDWDHLSEPYTVDNDAKFFYIDAELTSKGQEQALALQSNLSPDLLIVSPMRRAILTGLLAFPHTAAMASELCHERGGRHTCDKRLSKSALINAFPCVDFGAIESEDDPFWNDGIDRESCEDLANRAVRFIGWLLARKENHIAIATHSAFLFAVFNAALDCDSEARKWFGTGELRSVLLKTQ